MPVVRASEAVVHELHGVRFVSYAAPGTGSKELAAWRGEIPAGAKGPDHTISREEIFHVLTGSLRLTLDGTAHTLTAGDTAIANAGTTLGLENPTHAPATMWVTTSVGLEAELADGTRMAPPWANS
ncbi:cupin domain-containing protein [Streptomyces sp. SID14478]|uniref:cupin domain-containing protein n=1 Tax=Streptomyces sp. SID14478 TaxID=2706073 RepID=UPI0013DBEF0A|nr:cupin domain-containing protein [Streptomyces sp. SID14478]NEB79402.1 cupin domain-containing protein [Streptomyces sp. SID14478]